MKKRIFFSVDAHGSTAIWKKWLKIPELYEVDILMLCGDLTGKVLVPLIEQKDGSRKVFYFGQTYNLTTEDEITKMERKLADTGAYPIRCTEVQFAEWERDKEKVLPIIKKEILKRMENWLKMLTQEIDLQKITTIVMPGNDDDYEVDQIIKSFVKDGVVWCLDEAIEIDGVEMISLAHTNKTPWHTPREADEKELEEMIENLASKLKDPKFSIFNFHCPPYGTRLDWAPRLDRKLKPVAVPGGVEYKNVGSKAIRKVIEKYQPLLGLHGHIHESAGVDRIGKTIIINPGSEYSEGILRGYIIEIVDRKLENYYKVEG